MSDQKNHSSLRRRIYGTCCVLVGLCVLSSLFGVIGQNSLLRNFEEFERNERTLIKIASLERDVERLKAMSEKYLASGSAAQLKSALAIHDVLMRDIAEAQQVATSLNTQLERMHSSLEIFREQLERAAEERALRARLVMEDLPRQEQKLQHEIGELESLIANSNVEEIQLMLNVERDFSQALLNLRTYFIEPNAPVYERGLSAIKESRRRLKELAESSDDQQVRRRANELAKELVAFRKLGTRAFQATRGYLYYSDVVMAGEVSEFAYYSNQLKEFVESKREENREVQHVSATSARWTGVIASLISVGIAVVLSSRLSFSIVNPILKMTETFRCLGRGVTVDEIPALGRQDEIGGMARAAKVFNDKNRETKELLERSERLKQELTVKAEDLERTNEELDNFAYVASHDLKSPLRGLSHLASWVAEDCEDLLPSESQQHLEQMQERVKKMEQLLNDLLNYSRAGRVELTAGQICVQVLCDEIVTMVDAPEGFTFDIAGGEVIFKGYRTPLVQVLLNLMTNAVKYNDKGGDGFVKLEVNELNDFVQFTVSDNGRGIPEVYHEKVFRMYQRIATDVADGSGMGLAIVKKQIESLGGEIELKSQEGEGATFIFTWPKIDISSGSQASQPAISEGLASSGLLQQSTSSMPAN